MNWLDKLVASFAPQWGLSRARARLAMRHYEAASPGRRTQGWARSRADANVVNATAIAEIRMHARDLVRNNAWARRAQRVVANNTVGYGIVPVSSDAAFLERFQRWADSTKCESEGRHTFAALQHLAVKSMFESGEVLFRRRFRRPTDNIPGLPLQIQVLESDYLDSSITSDKGFAGGPIINGVEYDLLGRRVAYWLFPTHPGSSQPALESKRVPAADVLHVFYSDRPAQARGMSWLATSVLNLKDLDEYEDAELMKQKIAACFSAFVTDLDGQGAAIGEQDADDPLVETFEPGMVAHLPPGKDVKFGTPPVTVDTAFAQRNLRKIAAALGVTYEDLTGDYSQVNFSSARMARISHWANVYDWQWNCIIPLLCRGVWDWAQEAAGLDPTETDVDWTSPPMPMIEPDKEGLALQRLVRNGAMTHDEMVRQQGRDPARHWAEYAAGLSKLDELKISLDSDVRKVTAQGQEQQSQAPQAPAATEKPATEGEDERTALDDPELAITAEEMDS